MKAIRAINEVRFLFKILQQNYSYLSSVMT